MIIISILKLKGKSNAKSPRKPNENLLFVFPVGFFAIICPASSQWAGLKGEKWDGMGWYWMVWEWADWRRSQETATKYTKTPNIAGATNAGQRNQLMNW